MIMETLSAGRGVDLALTGYGSWKPSVEPSAVGRL